MLNCFQSEQAKVIERIHFPRGAKDFKGWRKPDGAVMVCAPSRWKNPYRVKVYGHERAIALYRQYLESMTPEELAAYLEPLRSATGLVCYCKLDQYCHADVLIKLLSAAAKDG